MKRALLVGMAFVGSLALLPCPDAGAKESKTGGSMIANVCLKCHKDYKDMADMLAGNLEGHSEKAKLIRIEIDKKMKLVKYEKDVRVDNLKDGIKDLHGHHHLRLNYKKVGADLVAARIVVKPEVNVSRDRLISTEKMERLVAMGPEKGDYTLVDSHGEGEYKEHHIPTAVSIPVFKMAKMKQKLPKNKDMLLIFYCGGVR